MSNNLLLRDLKNMALNRYNYTFADNYKLSDYLDKPIIAFAQVNDRCIFGAINNIYPISEFPTEILLQIDLDFEHNNTYELVNNEPLVIIGEDSVKSTLKCLTLDQFLDKIMKIPEKYDDSSFVYYKTTIEQPFPIHSYGLSIATKENIEDILQFPSKWSTSIIEAYKKMFISSGLMIGGDMSDYLSDDLD